MWDKRALNELKKQNLSGERLVVDMEHPEHMQPSGTPLFLGGMSAPGRAAVSSSDIMPTRTWQSLSETVSP